MRKAYQLTMFLISFLFLLCNCEKPVENELFLQNEWKLKSVKNKNKLFIVPSEKTFFREEAYILKFINDSCFVMHTSVNYAGGNYQITSEGQIIISYYGEWTEVYNGLEHQRNFDEQLVSVLNGTYMTYIQNKNKLIFRGEGNNEIIFKKQK